MLRWLARAVGLSVVAAALFALWQWWTWPDVAALARTNPATTAFVERWREREAAAGRQAPRQVLRFVPYGRISRELKLAVLVGEDIEFFSHDGFARREVRAALERAWDRGELPRGASTITQQLAKNLWLSPSRNPWRKVKEAMLTRRLERELPKKRILELYLNVAEFGRGAWGAEPAAHRWFGKSAAGLDAEQAAQLAASLPRPSQWHPGVSSTAYARYVRRLRARMDKARFLRGEI
jgi:monofunctional biosynthetic peptidoglycan transglycosylase